MHFLHGVASATGITVVPFSINHLRQESDTTPTEGATNSVVSTSRPLIYLLRPLASMAVPLGIELSTDHAPGHSSVWADGLSRNFPQVVNDVDDSNRFQVQNSQLLTRLRSWTL